MPSTAPPPPRDPCKARKAAQNEDGDLQCDLMADHPLPHWDPEYGEYF